MSNIDYIVKIDLPAIGVHPADVDTVDVNLMPNQQTVINELDAFLIIHQIQGTVKITSDRGCYNPQTLTSNHNEGKHYGNVLIQNLAYEKARVIMVRATPKAHNHE